MITEIPPVRLDEIFSLCESGQFEVCRIEGVQFDSTRLAATLDDILDHHELIQKDGYERYKGICLQYRDDATDLLYGDLGQMRGVMVGGQLQDGDIPRGWCMHVNQIGERFDEIFQSPLSNHVMLLRGRIIQALSGFAMKWHNDGPDNRRIHIPIRTNRSCLFQYLNGNSYHMPADGSAYIVNAAPDHRAVNLAAQPRTHITFSFLPIPPDCL